MANIVLTDDHVLLRNGLATLVKSLGHQVLFEAGNGKDFIAKLDTKNYPDVVLMDINMPEMDGYQTTHWLKENHPKVKVLALSMYDNENCIIRMLRCGARGYILKDSEPDELKFAIEGVVNKGYYYSDLVNSRLIYIINHQEKDKHKHKEEAKDNYSDGGEILSEKETEFLRYACTELTYKEISEKMNVSPRTIDNYRDNLFAKLHFKTRVGLAMYAIKNGIANA